MTQPKPIEEIISAAKRLAREYRVVTGRPLGITGEVAEHEAARLLGLELAEVRQAGYDATRSIGGKQEKIQIKSRVILPGARSGQRLGGLDLSKDWDTVLLVLMDEDFDATEIFEADRDAVEQALLEPGSKARNERGALSVSKFRSISKRVWPEV